MRVAERDPVAPTDHHDRAREEFGAQARGLLHSTGHAEEVFTEIGDDLA
jgi:hypothetical protein